MRQTKHERIFENGDIVTIANSEEAHRIGQRAEVLEVNRYQFGTDLYVRTDGKEEFWTDSNDVE